MIDLLNLLATLAIGLFAGALLTEGCILVPYWRAMEPSEFLQRHSEMGPSLFRYFAPLTTAAVLLSVFAAIASQFSGPAINGQVLAALMSVAALSVFFVYFKTANEKFASQRISEKELPTELAKWSNWHWLRTALVIGAFAISIWGLKGGI
ncbi:MAG: DUF1772 domain-containing protein [Parasphingorhabdus sp.]|uniref:DUF1772 domain-containing protein n=1 Tax=Parasphingorhabdus sp. TaxID=2709688 RepID=UPI003298AB04